MTGFGDSSIFCGEFRAQENIKASENAIRKIFIFLTSINSVINLGENVVAVFDFRQHRFVNTAVF